MKLYKFTILFLSILSVCYAQIPTQNLEAYWPFHGNPQDSSGHGNHGTVVNAELTTDRFGNCNEAYKFNGVNSRIVIPNSASIDMNNTADFSVSLWLKVHLNNPSGIPLCKNNYGSWSGYIIFANTSNLGYCNSPGHVSFYTASGGQQDACSDNSLDTNWHHVTGVYKYALNQSFLYVDGVLQSDIGQRSGGLSTVSDLIFGDNTHFNEPFMGSLDAIRIYRKALNSTEILQLYNEANPLGASVVNVIEDAVICNSTSYLLNASQANANSYLWSNGSLSSSLTVQTSGTYWVDMSINGCIRRDSAQIQMIHVDPINIVNDTFICSSPLILSVPNTSINVTWWNGSHASEVVVNSPGMYYLDYQIDACIFKDSILVTENSLNLNVLIPNIITPNGDGINDAFELKSENFSVKQFYLYNRWGQLVYAVTNNPVKWDGKQSGGLIDDGTYFWTLECVDHCSNPNEIIKNRGFLTVLK